MRAILAVLALLALAGCESNPTGPNLTGESCSLGEPNCYEVVAELYGFQESAILADAPNGRVYCIVNIETMDHIYPPMPWRCDWSPWHGSIL